jgi:ketosteroid isomerase-like protein
LPPHTESGNSRTLLRRQHGQVCHVWDVEDGKVSRFQQYVDTAKLHDVMTAS